jgi:hypothetical protein
MEDPVAIDGQGEGLADPGVVERRPLPVPGDELELAGRLGEHRNPSRPAELVDLVGVRLEHQVHVADAQLGDLRRVVRNNAPDQPVQEGRSAQPWGEVGIRLEDPPVVGSLGDEPERPVPHRAPVEGGLAQLPGGTVSRTCLGTTGVNGHPARGSAWGSNRNRTVKESTTSPSVQWAK